MSLKSRTRNKKDQKEKSKAQEIMWVELEECELIYLGKRSIQGLMLAATVGLGKKNNIK